MKATYRRKYLKRRIMYSYCHPGSFNPAVIGNKEARMIYGDMNTKCKGQTEALTRYFKRKENIFYFIQLKIYISIDSFRCTSSHLRRLKFKIFPGEHAPGPPPPPPVVSHQRVRFSPPLQNPLRGPCQKMAVAA